MYVVHTLSNYDNIPITVIYCSGAIKEKNSVNIGKNIKLFSISTYIFQIFNYIIFIIIR